MYWKRRVMETAWNLNDTNCRQKQRRVQGVAWGAKPSQSYRLAPPKIMSRSPPKSRNSLGVLALQNVQAKIPISDDTLAFCYIENSQDLLSPEEVFLSQNAPKIVCRPGTR